MQCFKVFKCAQKSNQNAFVELEESVEKFLTFAQWKAFSSLSNVGNVNKNPFHVSTEYESERKKAE